MQRKMGGGRLGEGGPELLQLARSMTSPVQYFENVVAEYDRTGLID